MEKLSDYNNNDIFWRDFVNLENNPYKLKTNMSNFKCVLIFPTKKNDISKNDYPLPLANMASLLRMNKGKVDIILQDLEENDFDKFAGYNLICFYPMVALFKKTLEFSKKIKEANPKSKICFFNSDQHQHEMVLGNPEAKEFATVIMKNYPSIDLVLIGEAESSFIRLCEKIANNDSNFSNLPSCLYRSQGDIKLSEKSIEPVNFTFLPFPARDFLEKTISPEGINTHSPRIQSSRGCIARCLYCVESNTNITRDGRKVPVLSRDILKTLDEIEMLYKHYKVVFFNIIDSSFEDPGKKGIERMRLFFEEILKRNIEISFKIHLRAESVTKLDDDFLDLMKEAGIDVLVIGVESGLEKELDSYKKIATVDQNITTIKRVNGLNGRFYPVIGHMMFSPILSIDDLPEKIAFLKELYHGWDYLELIHSILVYRGTKYHEFIKEKNLELPTNELSPVIHYKFEDERVKKVANKIIQLKTKCPYSSKLNNLLFDAANLISRYYNKMNRHLWGKEELFIEFKEQIDEILFEVEDIYCNYFLALVKLAKKSWDEEKAEQLYFKYVGSTIPRIYEETKNLIPALLDSFEKEGLSTNKLYLKTWKSIVLTQVDTTGGKIES